MARRTISLTIAWTLALALAGFGCGDDGDATTDTSTSATIGVAGGELVIGEGGVTVPENAVEAETEFVIEPVAVDELAGLPPGIETSLDAVRFEPGDDEFDTPVTVTLNHDGNADTVLALDGANDTTWDVIDRVERDGSTLTFERTRLGLFAAVSGCATYCGIATNACDSLQAEECAESCTLYGFNPSAVLGSTCVTQSAEVLECYSDVTDAASYACETGAPIQTTCTQQEAELADCVQTESTCYTFQGEWNAELSGGIDATTTATVTTSGNENEYEVVFADETPDMELFVQSATVYAEGTIGVDGTDGMPPTQLRAMAAPNCPVDAGADFEQELVFDVYELESGDDFVTLTLTR